MTEITLQDLPFTMLLAMRNLAAFAKECHVVPDFPLLQHGRTTAPDTDRPFDVLDKIYSMTLGGEDCCDLLWLYVVYHAAAVEERGQDRDCIYFTAEELTEELVNRVRAKGQI